jgi:hypothetical protein
MVSIAETARMTASRLFLGRQFLRVEVAGRRGRYLQTEIASLSSQSQSQRGARRDGTTLDNLAILVRQATHEPTGPRMSIPGSILNRPTSSSKRLFRTMQDETDGRPVGLAVHKTRP